MKYIKKLWSYKFRVLITIILIDAFITGSANGFIYGVLNLLGIYGIFAFGQFVQDEIEGSKE